MTSPGSQSHKKRFFELSCIACGAPVPLHHKFCTQCGTQINRQDWEIKSQLRRIFFFRFLLYATPVALLIGLTVYFTYTGAVHFNLTSPFMQFNQPNEQSTAASQPPLKDSVREDVRFSVSVPDSISENWEGVSLATIRESDYLAFKVMIGETLYVPDSEIKVAVNAYFPDVILKDKIVTSKSNEPQNQAIAISIIEKGKRIFKGVLKKDQKYTKFFTVRNLSLVFINGIAKNRGITKAASLTDRRKRNEPVSRTMGVKKNDTTNQEPSPAVKERAVKRIAPAHKKTASSASRDGDAREPTKKEIIQDHLKKADQYMMAGEYANAVIEYNTVLFLDQNNQDAQWGLEQAKNAAQ